jgi:hypothetical protein
MYEVIIKCEYKEQANLIAILAESGLLEDFLNDQRQKYVERVAMFLNPHVKFGDEDYSEPHSVDFS